MMLCKHVMCQTVSALCRGWWTGPSPISALSDPMLRSKGGFLGTRGYLRLLSRSPLGNSKTGNKALVLMVYGLVGPPSCNMWRKGWVLHMPLFLLAAKIVELCYNLISVIRILFWTVCQWDFTLLLPLTCISLLLVPSQWALWSYLLSAIQSTQRLCILNMWHQHLEVSLIVGFYGILLIAISQEMLSLIWVWNLLI